MFVTGVFYLNNLFGCLKYFVHDGRQTMYAKLFAEGGENAAVCDATAVGYCVRAGFLHPSIYFYGDTCNE